MLFRIIVGIIRIAGILLVQRKTKDCTNWAIMGKKDAQM